MPTYTESEIIAAAERALLDGPAVLRLREELAREPQQRSRFESSHIAYYFGGLLIAGAMGWFVTDAWDRLPSLALCAIGLAYMLAYGVAGYLLARRPSTLIPGGVLMAVAVSMTPLAVFGLERYVGWWPASDPGGFANFHPHVAGSWVLMEAATVLVSAAALRLVRFPFVLAPAAYALWYMSMDAPELLLGHTIGWHQRCWITVGFGLILMLIGYFADGETDADFAFWFYLFGVLAFSGGLTFLGDGPQLGKAVYCAVHLLLIACSVLLQRRIFLVFGALGVFLYLVGEARGYFRNSFAFAVVLTLIGTVMMVAGLLLKRHQADILAGMQRYAPERIKYRLQGKSV